MLAAVANRDGQALIRNLGQLTSNQTQDSTVLRGGPWASSLRQAVSIWLDANNTPSSNTHPTTSSTSTNNNNGRAITPSSSLWLEEKFGKRLKCAEYLLEAFKVDSGEWLQPVLLKAIVLARKEAKLDPQKLTKVKELMDACFRASIASDAGNERKLLAMNILVEQFKVFFALGTPVMCRGLVVATRKPGFPEDEEFPAAARVAYWFLSAKLAAMEDDPATALVDLRSAHAAMASCPPAPAHSRNAARIENLLVVVSVALGLMPTQTLIESLVSRAGEDDGSCEGAKAKPILALLRSISAGNVKRLLRDLEYHRSFFSKLGAYFLVAGRCRNVAERQLVRASLATHRTQIGDENTNKIPFSVFHEPFEALGAPSPTPVSRRIVAVLSQLIELGLVRGYISVEKEMVVLSSKEPFPKTAVVMGGASEEVD